ncbi:unnamed protein product [Polarella glacialis]|uniref:Protein kinase domain-containing protein n=1 Tax=Polarella glacialis TaxID=89957 RepID=A0A813FMF3_POLGL|nr:unnamed protein product [Polarella glacialis]CAE8736076.1 unnamed protein product [Polarella glacialis]
MQFLHSAEPRDPKIKREVVVHHDLKPENLLIAQDGSLRICDVGLGKALDPADNKHQSSSSLRFSMTSLRSIGAELNMARRAPELLRDAKQITPAVDVWSLLVLLGVFF